MKKLIVLALLVPLTGCSSLKGVQTETCETVAAVVVPLFCPKGNDNEAE